MGTLGTEGASNYNALQVSVNNNLWHGLFFTFAYTYSHALDDASGLESSGFNGPGTNYFPGYHHLSYGSSDFDARQRVVASYDYGIPLLASMNQQPISRKRWGAGISPALRFFNPASRSTLRISGRSCPDIATNSAITPARMYPPRPVSTSIRRTSAPLTRAPAVLRQPTLTTARSRRSRSVVSAT